MCKIWCTKLAIGILIVLFSTVFYMTISFKPLSKQEHIEKFHKLNQDVEPFRRNLSECARQVKASMSDVNNFLKRVPQQTMQGKCFVACILKRNSLIKNNKISPEHLMAISRETYGNDEEVLKRLEKAIAQCSRQVGNVFEICEYASEFNDCMHMNMEHILDKLAMERRMQALGQISVDPDPADWNEEEEEMLKLLKDEL